MSLRNEESLLVARFYGLAEEGPDVPAWLTHIDGLKSREKEERGEVGPHVVRVALMSRELALSIGMDERRAEEIRLAALWHDVGKLMMPDRFFEPGYVSQGAADRADIVPHAENGRRLLMQVEGVPPIFLEIAAYHHERYDGHGYNRIVGEAIPFHARVVQVADVYDGINAARSYKDPVPPGLTLSRMTDDTVPPRQGRREFDPFLLRRFVALREKELESAPEAERRHLAAYAASLPMDDLRYLDRDPGVFIHSDGSREIDAADGGPAVYLAADGTPAGPGPQMHEPG